MVRLGIAGMGYIGRVHYEAARKLPGVQVIAASSSRGEELRTLCPDLEILPTYDALLADARIDAIVVAVPTFVHEEYVIRAAEAGRHVLCEKPLTLNAPSAARIVDAVNRAGVTCMVAQVLRFWPEYVQLKAYSDEGLLGKILSVRAFRLNPRPVRSKWLDSAEQSGGCLLDLQVHDVDFVFWLLGRPLEVQSWGMKSKSGRWDQVHTVLTYSGTVVSIEASHLMPAGWPHTSGIRAVGSSAAFEYTFRSGDDMRGRKHSISVASFYAGDGSTNKLHTSKRDMFVAQLEYFVECLRKRSQPTVCPLEESHEVMRIMDALQQSAETGKGVKLREFNDSHDIQIKQPTEVSAHGQ